MDAAPAPASAATASERHIFFSCSPLQTNNRGLDNNDSQPTALVMHSSLIRLQNVFGFFTSVAFTVAAAVALSVVLNPQTPAAKLELRNIQV